jgi:hypothetical protein
VWRSAGSPADNTEMVRRIRDAVGVDPINLESGDPKLLSRPGGVGGNSRPRGGRARRRSAMLRRMKVAMLRADADSVADGHLDILGGGRNITGPRAWHGQSCAELEARLAPLPVPWHGIAARRCGGV